MRKRGERVFVLGAGFSKHAGFPLVRDLQGIVSGLIHGDMAEKFGPFLRPQPGYPKGQFQAGIDSVPDGAFEEVLGALIARVRKANEEGDTTHPSFVALRVLRETTSRALWMVHEGLDGLPSAYQSFGKNLLATKGRVISFNWDVLTERAVTDAAGPGIAVPWSYTADQTRAGQVRIIKPHGSINWNGFLRAGSFSHHPDVWTAVSPSSRVSFPTDEPLSDPDAQGISEDARFIRLPGDPDAGDPDLDLIWAECSQVLRDAKRVVFLGYSLPPYDETSAAFFREACAGKQVEVVNPSEADIQRFRDALGREVIAIPERFEHSPYATDAWPGEEGG